MIAFKKKKKVFLGLLLNFEHSVRAKVCAVILKNCVSITIHVIIVCTYGLRAWPLLDCYLLTAVSVQYR